MSTDRDSDALLEARRERWEEIVESKRATSRRVGVLASFTAERLVPYLGVALEEIGLGADIHLGAYNQIIQELLSPDSGTCTARPSSLVVWARLEELWLGRGLPLNEPPAPYVADLLSCAETALSSAASMGANLIMVLPAVPEVRPLGVGDAATASGVFATAVAAREALRERIARAPSAVAVDAEEIMRYVGAAQALDERLDSLFHIPYTDVFFAAVGHRIARALALGWRASRKLIVVDGDNTLWGGTLGEDGVDGIQIGDAGAGRSFQGFQRFLLELRRAGALLALASKNDESDVWRAFDRPEMVLRKEHLAGWRVGWQSKHVSVTQLAEELSLGLDSMVFIDDNPAEIAQMQAAHGAVASILMPPEPSSWWPVMRAADVLDRLPPTAEDLLRSEFYQQESQRRELAQGLPLADYVRSLEVKVGIEPPKATDLARLSQLVNKTNQFNLNGVRRSEAEIVAMLESGSRAWIVRARDKFGDYGIVGAAITSPAPGGRQSLATFLLSCRALGRKVEDAMLAHVLAEARRAGVSGVIVKVVETPRNLPVRMFFEKLGATAGSERELVDAAWPDDVLREQP